MSGFKEFSQNLPRLGCGEEIPFGYFGAAPAMGEKGRPPIGPAIADRNESGAGGWLITMNRDKALGNTKTDFQPVAVDTKGNDNWMLGSAAYFGLVQRLIEFQASLYYHRWFRLRELQRGLRGSFGLVTLFSRADLVGRIHRLICRSRAGRMHSSSSAGLWWVGPSAVKGAELQFAFAPCRPPQLARLNLVFQIFGGLEQCCCERVVSGFGSQAWAMDRPRPSMGRPRDPGVQAGAGKLQLDLDAVRWVDIPLVFEGDVSGSHFRQPVQMCQLFLHLPVPGDLSVETEITKVGFHN